MAIHPLAQQSRETEAGMEILHSTDIGVVQPAQSQQENGALESQGTHHRGWNILPPEPLDLTCSLPPQPSDLLLFLSSILLPIFLLFVLLNPTDSDVTAVSISSDVCYGLPI